MCKSTLDQLRVDSAASGDVTHTKAAVIGARAAWSLEEWDLMDAFVGQLPRCVCVRVCVYVYVDCVYVGLCVLVCVWAYG